jgi:hypothetical protein
MSFCVPHPDREACDETEGWTVPLCSACHWMLGSPERECHWGSLYGIGAVVLLAEEQRQSEQLRHPEVAAYQSHFPDVNPRQVASQ